jgi:hypothetical protein
VKNTKLLLLSSFAIAGLSGCKVTFPDVKLCSVAGIFAAGMDCSYTGHDENSEMTAKEMIDFLEAGAICMSSEDRKREKTAIEKACVKLGNGCSFEVKQLIQSMDRIEKRKK